jgi:putative FmdB family regulatory protein
LAILFEAMPIYEYRCENGHEFEVMQRMGDDPVTLCEVCEVPVRKVFRPVAVHFKGSGFYNTDYGTRKRSREKEAHESSKSDKSSKDSKSDSGATKSSDSSKSSDGAKSGNSSDSSGSSKKSETKAA